MPLERITITIPKEVLEAADRHARELDRSRSWVVAEAVRRYGEPRGHESTTEHRSVVREPPPPPPPLPLPLPPPAAYAASEVEDARRRHLRAEATLSPGERLRRAEELGRLARRAQRRGRREQVIGFESYEDFYEWKKRRLIGA